MNTKISKDDFIAQSKRIHSNRFNYDKVQFRNLTDPIIVECYIHGEVKTTPRSHLNQKWGCGRCAASERAKLRYLTTSEFVNRAKQVHGDKYDYSNADYKPNKKISVTCRVHGDFLLNPNDHIYAKSGCTKCSGNYKWTTADFIDKARLVHKDTFDYSKVHYKNSSTKLTIICRSHGEFIQSPTDHLQGSGCTLCSREQMIKNKVLRGHAIDPKLKTPFSLYRDKVRKLSNENYRKYYYDINPLNLKRGHDWHLDHIISIAAGFTNNLLAEQIADPSNLRIISAQDNRSKNVYSCDAVSSFDPNHIKTKELGELALKEKRKKHSNVYQITDTHTGEVKIVDLLIDWCNERGYSVSSARWSANYTTSLFKDRYLIKKVDDSKTKAV